MSANMLEDRITSASKAIILVHQNGAVADTLEHKTIADRHGLVLIEDCSHAHGAWVEKIRVGGVGHSSIFSMQQTKLLTAGEGGALITNDDRVAITASRIRASGRMHRYDPVGGGFECDEQADIVGFNFVMPEFAALLLEDQLDNLDNQNQVRCQNAEVLVQQLAQIEGVEPIVGSTPGSQRVFHKFVIKLTPSLLRTRSLLWFCRAIEAEIGVSISPLHVPLFMNPLLPHRDRVLTGGAEHASVFPVSVEAFEHCLTFRHRFLLGSEKDMTHIAQAFEKVIDACRSD